MTQNSKISDPTDIKTVLMMMPFFVVGVVPTFIALMASAYYENDWPLRWLMDEILSPYAIEATVILGITLVPLLVGLYRSFMQTFK